MRAPVIGDAWNDYRRFVESASVKRAVRSHRESKNGQNNDITEQLHELLLPVTELGKY